MQLSEKILLLRKRRGLSQDQLAKEINVSRQAIYKWETGITTPDIDNVKQLSEFFNIPFNELVDDKVSIQETPITITKEKNSDTPTGILQGDAIVKNKNRTILFALISTLSLVIVVLSVILIVSLGKHTHSFGDYIIEIQPTCTVAGIERRYCECGESESRSIATIPHSEITVEGYNSTCLRIGLTDGKKCSVCNMVLKEQAIIPVNQNNHVEEIVKGTPSTCISTGLTDGTKCTECGITLNKQEVIPTGSHKEEIVTGYGATCVKDGLTDGIKCSVCYKVLKEQSAIPLNSNNHNEVIIRGYNATCIRDGLTDGKKCSLCNTVLLEQEVIISNGQHVEETVKGYPSTCLKSGLTDKVICIECGDTLVESTPLPLGNCSGSEVLGYESTCTVVGLTKGSICSVCEKTLVKQEIMQTKSHDYIDNRCTMCNNLKENYSGFSFKLNDDKCSYTVFTDKDIEVDNLIIPSTSEGYPVTCVGDFSKLDGVGKITLPNTVTEIKENAFYNVSSIYYIDFPMSLTSIGKSAFFGTSIKSITIPRTLTSIGSNVFEASMLRYIIFEEGTTKIDSSLFSDLTTIKCVYIPKSVTEISGAICGESENAVIYRHVDANTSKWNGNWDTCKDNGKCQVNEVTYCPESFTPFTFTLNNDKKSYTVSGNESIMDEEIFIIPSTYMGYPVTHIDEIAFYDTNTDHYKSRYKVREVYIPDSVIVIGRYAFCDCESLTYVKFGSGVKEIHNRAFMSADLREINLPKSINFIDSCAFSYCSSVSKITLENDCSAYKLIDGVLYSKNGALLVLYPNASQQDSYIIPEGVKTIHGGAFCDSINLTSITLPNTLKVIGELSFQNCKNIKTIDLPDGLTAIKDFAFAGCMFDTIYIPLSVTSIETYSLNFNTQSNNIYYNGEKAPDSWNFINRWMIRFTPNVKEYGTTENGLKYVITNDDELIITSGEKSDGKVPSTINGYEVSIIGKNAFWTNNTLTTITLPNTIKRIEDSAFLGTSLEYIVLPSGVEYLGNNVFDRSNNLKYIYIPDTVTTIAGPLLPTRISAIRIYYQKDADMTNWDANWNKYMPSGSNTYYNHNTFKVESPDDIQWVW